LVTAAKSRKPENAFDGVQGITAITRDKAHQDNMA
jgi:hypothetical protein